MRVRCYLVMYQASLKLSSIVLIESYKAPEGIKGKGTLGVVLQK